MGERRSKRMERLAEEEAARLGLSTADTKGSRKALSQRAGEAFLSGDMAKARALEASMRHRDRPERATHGFHTYPAGLHPDAARDLVAMTEGAVLDPFCGGGTVLLEAMLAGREALGLDVSPIACMVARARTARSDEAARTALRSGARAAADVALKAPGPASHAHAAHLAGLPPDVASWYEPHVITELAALREAIGRDDALRAVFSAVLVKASRRASDTSNTREDVSRPPGTTATLFHKKAREYARMLEELEQLVAATANAAQVRARVHREDSRKQRERDAFGAVVTSPPYPGVYDYVPMQQLRLTWLGLDPGSGLREELGPRRAFRADRSRAMATWREDTRRWVRCATRALHAEGTLTVIVGDGWVLDRKVDSLGALDEAASAAGLGRVACASVERWDEGVRAMRLEHAVMYRKPTGATVPDEAPDDT